MFVDDYYKFKISVSVDNYWNKEDVNACIGSSKNATNKQIRLKYGRSTKSKISFREVEVTASELLDYCIHGYTFCNLFRGYPDSGQTDKGKTVSYRKKDGSFTMSAKCDKYFYGSNVICADIEEIGYQTIQDYVSRISIKPTFWYSTFSHMQPNKGVRFRMVYVLDQTIIGKEQFEAIVDAFNHRIENEVYEEMHDKCNKKPAQYFNGTNIANGELSIEYDGSGCIYSINDIINVNNIKIEREDNNKTTTYYTSCQNDHNTNIMNIPLTITVPEPYYWLLYDIDNLDYDTFMKYNRHKYTYTYRMDTGEWINDTYQFVPDNFFALYWPVNKLCDGNKRRKKIFERMCLRRLMNPNIDIDTIIFCAYEDIHLFCDNSDKVFNAEYLERNAQNAFELTLEEIEEKYSYNIAYLRSKRPKDGIILKSGTAYAGYANVIKKNIRYEIIDRYYDSTMSVKENMALLPGLTGLYFTERTLYRYCKDRGVSLKNKDEDILPMIDTSLTVEVNHAALQNLGIRIGTKRVNRLLNLVREQQTQQQAMSEQPQPDPNSYSNSTANEWSGHFWGTAYTSPFGF